MSGLIYFYLIDALSQVKSQLKGSNMRFATEPYSLYFYMYIQKIIILIPKKFVIPAEAGCDQSRTHFDLLLS